jgi:hypothetical protein
MSAFIACTFTEVGVLFFRFAKAGDPVDATQPESRAEAAVP